MKLESRNKGVIINLKIPGDERLKMNHFDGLKILKVPGESRVMYRETGNKLQGRP